MTNNDGEIAFEFDNPGASESEIELDFEHVARRLRQGYTRPFLLIDPAIIRAKARRFRRAMPRVCPHYAVKANPDPRILKLLIEEGVGFEIASIAELDLLLELKVEASQIYYSNPMKSRAYLEYAAQRGVKWYVTDSIEELRKIGSVKPDAKLYLRCDTPNLGSDWPLAGKFGADPAEVSKMIGEAARLQLDLAGVTFHVGSQCRNPENWRIGIDRARDIFDEMRSAGLSPRLLNLGGGYPVQHLKPIPSIELIGEIVNRAIENFPPEVRIMAEPGRFLVSDSGIFVCRVVGTATRSGRRWAYWDAGMFGGLIETAEGLRPRIRTDRGGAPIPWTVAGPTCDSLDILMRDEPLPEDLQPDDFVYLINSGAYTTAYASTFNGFPLPELILL